MIKLNKIESNKSYLLAVSGGVDSMVMADLFRVANCTFSVVHCNFQLREEEAELDTLLVKEWCTKYEIPCFVKYFNTQDFAKQHNLSIQVAARRLRYAYFDDLVAHYHFDNVVTAHHCDDNVETILFHFFRGTGIQGLTGIPTARGYIIRPLLDISKQDLEEYAHKFNVPFRLDISNQKTDYTRNKIRLEVIPQLSSIFPNFKNNMQDNLVRFNEVNQLYKQKVDEIRKTLIEQRGKDYYIPLLKLKKIQPLKTVLFEMLIPFGFTAEQIPQVIDLMNRQTGSYIDSENCRLIRNRNFFIITSKSAPKSEIIVLESSAEEVSTADFELSIKYHTGNNFTFYKDSMHCAIDTSKLVWPLLLRKRRDGDYMYPFGMQKKKKISKILIDAKIPLHEKDKVWVLESDKKIIWVLGIKADNRFRVSENTKEVLEFKLRINDNREI